MTPENLIMMRALADELKSRGVLDGGPLHLATGHEESKRILVDLDSTLAEKVVPFDHQKVGPPRKGAREFVEMLRKLADEVCICTAREHLEPVRRWVKENGIAVNGVGNRKLPCLCIIDDLGVNGAGDLMSQVLPMAKRFLSGNATHLSTAQGQWQRIDLSLADVLTHPFRSIVEGYHDLMRRLRDEPEVPVEELPPQDVVGQFMGGEWMDMPSSNVQAARYLPLDAALEIEYRNGGLYRYDEIPADMARSFAQAPSYGKWIWSHLRVRGVGNAYAFQKPYSYISSVSSYVPRWMQSAQTRLAHGAIGPSGT